MTVFVLILATLATSLLSGVFSMAGGVILMGVFSFFLAVPAAMVLHGTAQTFSNGSRVWHHRKHIRWEVLLPYSVGAALILCVFSLIAFVPHPGLVFLLIGLFPLLALVMPRGISLDMQNRRVALLSGLIVTTAQMLAGASGPVLDIFYQKSGFTRHEILGTKAVTQTLGHLIKLGYYAAFLSPFSGEISSWTYGLIVAAALAGNWIGKEVVEKISDREFRKLGRYLIVIIGLIYTTRGILELSSTVQAAISSSING